MYEECDFITVIAENVLRKSGNLFCGRRRNSSGDILPGLSLTVTGIKVEDKSIRDICRISSDKTSSRVCESHAK